MGKEKIQSLLKEDNFSKQFFFFSPVKTYIVLVEDFYNLRIFLGKGLELRHVGCDSALKCFLYVFSENAQ